MIDETLRKNIKLDAGISFEQIAPDFLECGVGYADDAVGPTVTNMCNDAHPDVQKIAEDYRHPDRQEFMSIVLSEVKKYF